MIAVPAIEITGSNLVSSSIAEPDISIGEVEWIDPSILTALASFGTYRWASALGLDGNIYCVGGGDILKIDVDGQTVSTFGSYTSEYFAMTTANDGSIYCAGTTDILKIDVDGQTVSTFGSYTGRKNASTLGFDGNIYCVGNAPGNILKIDVDGQTVSTFGSYTDTYDTCVSAADGYIYCFGASEKVLKINITSQSTEIIIGHANTYSASLDIDGSNIYCVGSGGYVSKLNIVNQSFSKLDSAIKFYDVSSLAGDGNIYCVGRSDVLKIDTGSQTVSTFGIVTVPFQCTMTTSNDGNIYCASYASATLTPEVLKIRREYLVDEVIASVSSHKIYKSSIVNKDKPEDGALKTPPTWVEIGPTNKYAAFDTKLTSQAKSNLTQVYDIKPSKVIGAVAAFNMSGVSSVNVTMTDPAEGVVYNRDLTIADNSGVVSWFTYFFTAIISKKEFVILDLPPYLNATTTITFTGTSKIGVGAIVIGEKLEIGTTDYQGTSVKTLDFSIWKEDSFGNLEITKRPDAKLVNFGVNFDESALGYVSSSLEKLRGNPAVCVGSDKETDDYTLVFGQVRSSEIDIKPRICSVPIQVRGYV